METRLNGIPIDRYDGERAGYPTLCLPLARGGRGNPLRHRGPTSLNTLELLPQLLEWACAHQDRRTSAQPGLRGPVTQSGARRSTAAGAIPRISFLKVRPAGRVNKGFRGAVESPLGAWATTAPGSDVMKLSLGPILTTGRSNAFDFTRMASQPVDIVYLGETVCSLRRHELRFDDWMEVAGRLRCGQAGGDVHQTLIESESDLKMLRKIVGNGNFTVEANDMGAVRLLAERKLPFVAGPTLNVFNAETPGILKEAGATRWVMPPECGAEMLAALLTGAGRYRDRGVCPRPSAAGHSARCFTARRFNLR